jgi:hypothetical protein
MAKKSTTKKAAKPLTEGGSPTDRFTLLHPTAKKTAQPIPEDGSQAEQDGVAELEKYVADRRPKDPGEGYLTAGLDDLPQAIEELGREATIALHHLLQRTLGKTGNPFQAAARFQPVTTQVDAIAEFHRRNGRRRLYGQTLMPGTTADWITRYMAEVDACCKKHMGNEDLGAELDRLHKMVEDVQVSEVVEAHAAGITEAVKEVGRTKARLLARLRETREWYAPPPAGQGAKFKWLGGMGELANLVHHLADKNWIPGQSVEKQARLVAQLFLWKGKEINPGSMKTFLAEKGTKDPGGMMNLGLPKNKKAQ